jgi:hypothetical protein
MDSNQATVNSKIGHETGQCRQVPYSTAHAPFIGETIGGKKLVIRILQHFMVGVAGFEPATLRPVRSEYLLSH